MSLLDLILIHWQNGDIFLLMIGCIAGFISGLLGIGGGLVSVPLLIYFFRNFHALDSNIAIISVATSLSTILFSSIISSITHYRMNNFNRSIIIEWSIKLMVGALLSALIFSQILPNWIFQIIIFIILFSSALALTFKWTPSKHFYESKFSPIIIGSISSLAGIGGGNLISPILTLKYKISIKKAIGNASILCFPIALFGCIGYLSTFELTQFMNNHLAGYIYLPGTLLMGIGNLLFVRFGIKIQQILSSKTLEKLLSIVLFASCSKILIDLLFY